MGFRNFLMIALVSGGLISEMPAQTQGQATPKPATQRSDAPYHATDMSKPEAET